MWGTDKYRGISISKEEGWIAQLVGLWHAMQETLVQFPIGTSSLGPDFKLSFYSMRPNVVLRIVWTNLTNDHM